MYSSDGGTDLSKSNDADILVSIHSSISSPTIRTISDFTLLYTTSTTTQYETELKNSTHYPTILKTTDKNEEQHRTKTNKNTKTFYPPD